MLTRLADPADAQALVANVADGFASYTEWAPDGWAPPAHGPAEVARLAGRLAEPGVWCLIAIDGDLTAGHVGIGPTTREDPAPAPAGTTNVWQLFVRGPWRGSGVAGALMGEAIAEAQRRGFHTMRLWTPQGAGRARRFYEREGFIATGAVHEHSPSGLVTVQYARSLRGEGESESEGAS
jgi:GNAT superfamily N-acetyltransferase